MCQDETQKLTVSDKLMKNVWCYNDLGNKNTICFMEVERMKQKLIGLLMAMTMVVGLVTTIDYTGRDCEVKGAKCW